MMFLRNNVMLHCFLVAAGRMNSLFASATYEDPQSISMARNVVSNKEQRRMFPKENIKRARMTSINGKEHSRHLGEGTGDTEDDNYYTTTTYYYYEEVDTISENKQDILDGTALKNLSETGSVPQMEIVSRDSNEDDIMRIPTDDLQGGEIDNPIVNAHLPEVYYPLDDQIDLNDTVQIRHKT